MPGLILLKKNIDSLLVAVAGFVIILLFTWHSGIGLCPDGVAYITSAENLKTSGKLADFTGDPLVNFPAFYPFFLFIIMVVIGLKIFSFASFLNAFLFGLLIYISGAIMEHFTYRSRWYKIAVLSCIVLSPGLLEDYSMLWSETIFILFLMLFMMTMRRYFISYSHKALITAAIFASLASVTRYVGVTIIATGGLLILMDKNLPQQKKVSNLILYSIISPSLLITNFIRNYFVSGTLMGFREKSQTSLIQNMRDAGAVFSDWFPFLQGHDSLLVWVTIALLTILITIFFLQMSSHGRVADYQGIAATFSLIYILFMTISSSVSRFEMLNSRFMTPVFIPLIWCTSYCIVSLYHKAIKPVKSWTVVIGILFFVSFQYNQLGFDYETWDGVKDAGIPGYTEDQWTKSETVKFIRQDLLPFKKGYTIYSDADDAVYFFTGRHGEFLPHKEVANELQSFMNNSHCYVVWFDDGNNPDLVDRDFILHIKKMKLVKQFNDGAIYEYNGVN